MPRRAILVVALALLVTASPPGIWALPPEAAGVIVAVDRTEECVCVEVEGDEVWLFKGPSTTVTIGGYAAAFADLRPGYRVAVTYDALTGEALRVAAER